MEVLGFNPCNGPCMSYAALSTIMPCESCKTVIIILQQVER